MRERTGMGDSDFDVCHSWVCETVKGPQGAMPQTDVCCHCV